MGRYKHARNAFQYLRDWQHEHDIVEARIWSDAAEAYMEEGGGADTIIQGYTTPEKAASWAQKRDAARKRFVDMALYRFEKYVQVLIPSVPDLAPTPNALNVPVPPNVTVAPAPGGVIVKHNSQEWPTVIELSDGTFAEIGCPHCKGNAIADPQTGALKYLKGIHGISNHMFSSHGSNPNRDTAAIKQMTLRQLTPVEIVALNFNAPGAPKIEKIPCLLPSEGTGSQLPPFSAGDIEPFSQEFDKLGRSDSAGSSILSPHNQGSKDMLDALPTSAPPRPGSSGRKKRPAPPKRVNLLMKHHKEDEMGTDTQNDKMWLERDIKNYRDDIMSWTKSEPRKYF
ncbi:hypothetical protein BU16DRAFT_180468 [Lophium mytilinum]|uniref:Uncharacterized protein n=1 Tax=Lophium mytilinum TaxID=390894 RepID=A0A6A6QAH8_9PEZI|nr:hypothetical protein BU16DRAFT_180468 [Lophium mytilinum]